MHLNLFMTISEKPGILLFVTVIMCCFSCNDDYEKFTPHIFKSDINQIFDFLKDDPIVLDFNPESNNTLELQNGVYLHIPQNSLWDIQGNNPKGMVQVHAKILNSRGDLIRNNITLTTSENEIIHHVLTWHLEFTQNQQKLTIHEGIAPIQFFIETTDQTGSQSLFRKTLSDDQLWYNTCNQCGEGNVPVQPWTIVTSSDEIQPGHGYSIEISETGWYSIGTPTAILEDNYEQGLEITLPENFGNLNTKVFISLHENEHNFQAMNWTDNKVHFPVVLGKDTPIFDIVILAIKEDNKAAYNIQSRHVSGNFSLKEVEMTHLKEILKGYQ
jgi:hypothetical protein